MWSHLLDRVTIAYTITGLLLLAVAGAIFLAVYNSPDRRVFRRVSKETRAYQREQAQRDDS